MEAIILAGGLGTRLRGVIGEAPKCMAPVAGEPFLHWVFCYLQTQGCTRVILSLGYKHDAVEAWLAQSTWPFEIDKAIEEEPLGTGGGIYLALQKARKNDVFVLNGDTMFDVSLDDLYAFHTNREAETTLALKHMVDFDRYGVVRTDEDGTIIAFEEKWPRTEGFINGGVYCINRLAFLNLSLPKKFSFEKDYLEATVKEQKLCGYLSEAYFIDIGIPTDYAQAQQDFKIRSKA